MLLGFACFLKHFSSQKVQLFFVLINFFDSLCFFSATTLNNFSDYFFLILKLVFNALFYLCVLLLIVGQLYGMEIVFNVIPG